MALPSPPQRLMARLSSRIQARLAGQPALANVLRLLAGNASAQVLTLAAYPVLTRIYSPQEMGVLSVLTSALTILAPMASLRLEMALPLARTAREASSVLAASVLALLGICAAFTLLLGLLPPNWPRGLAAAAPYWWFLPLSLLAFGGYVIMVNEGTRQNRFADVARTRVVQAFSGPLTQIGFGLLGGGTLGLLAGFVIGQSSGTVNLARRLLGGPRSPWVRVTVASVRAAVHRHRHFALFTSWANVVNAAANYLMTVAFAFVYGTAIAGFMFLGERVLMRPLFLITSSILPVYTRELGQAWLNDRSRLRPLFIGVVKRQALLSAAWIVPIVLLAPLLIPLAFGPGWAESARFLQVLAIGYFPSSVLHPVLHTLQMIREQRLSAVLDLGHCAAVVAAVAAVAWLKLPPLEGAVLCSLVQAASQCVVLVLTWRRVKQASATAGQASHSS